MHETGTGPMGCCLSHPVTEVLEDPSVLAHAVVRDIEYVKGNFRRSSRGCNGLLYIKDGGLYHHIMCGRKFCCGCCRQHFLLSCIKTVEVIENETILISGAIIHLRPGLRITLEEPASSTSTILVAIPEAATFAPKLLSACGLSEKDNF